MTQLQKRGFLKEDVIENQLLKDHDWEKKRAKASVFGSDCSRKGWICEMKAEARQSVQMFNVCLCIKQ